jgi:hypothetical protein
VAGWPLVVSVALWPPAVLLACRWVRRRAREQVDAVAGGPGEAVVGLAQSAIAQDRDREAAGRPGDGAECLTAGRGTCLQGNLEDLIAG